MNDVAKYIAQFPEETQQILLGIRTIITREIPNAEEKLNYGIPSYYLNSRPVVYFGGFKNHIGFYATPESQVAFQEELSAYKQGKGSVQFPLDNIPYDLILRIVKFRKAFAESKE